MLLWYPGDGSGCPRRHEGVTRLSITRKTLNSTPPVLLGGESRGPVVTGSRGRRYETLDSWRYNQESGVQGLLREPVSDLCRPGKDALGPEGVGRRNELLRKSRNVIKEVAVMSTSVKTGWKKGRERRSVPSLETVTVCQDGQREVGETYGRRIRRGIPLENVQIRTDP